MNNKILIDYQCIFIWADESLYRIYVCDSLPDVQLIRHEKMMVETSLSDFIASTKCGQYAEVLSSCQTAEQWGENIKFP